jgi:hypothetical protein
MPVKKSSPKTKAKTNVKKVAAKVVKKAAKKPAKKVTPKKVTPKKAAPNKRAPAANAIRVPRAKVSSFDPDRKLERNQLLKTQVLNFAEMNRQLPEYLRCPIAVESIQTEGQAAAYIRHVSTHLAAGEGLTKTRGGAE